MITRQKDHVIKEQSLKVFKRKKCDSRTKLVFLICFLQINKNLQNIKYLKTVFLTPKSSQEMNLNLLNIL